MEPIITFPGLGNLTFDFPSSFHMLGRDFYWYGVIIACGFLLAMAYCLARCQEFGISQDDLLDTVLFAVPFGIIGARAYYVIFYGSYDNFWDMCKIWEGGLAIYGGIIAAVITVLIVCRVKKISPLAMLDIACFGLFIGQSIGRWGNFTNREAFGSATDVFCRMGLTYADGTTIYVHPCFLYESLWNAVGFLALHIFSKKHERKFDGELFALYVGWYGLGRMFIEGLRTDSLYVGSTDIRVSQVLAAVSLLAVIVLFVVVLKRKKYAPEKLFVNRVALTQELEETVDAAETEEVVDAEKTDAAVKENTSDTEAEESVDAVDTAETVEETDTADENGANENAPEESAAEEPSE